MRKIISQEEKEKKDSKRKFWLGIILVLLMLMSTAGYAFYSSSYFDGSNNVENIVVEYKGHEFSYINGLWGSSIGGYNFQTTYNPLEVNSSLTTKTVNDYVGKNLYFGVNSVEDINYLGNQELASNIGVVASKVLYSCLDKNCQQDYPIKNCSEDNIIIFVDSEEEFRIVDNQKCVTIYTSNEYSAKAADSFLFGLLGI